MCSTIHTWLGKAHQLYMCTNKRWTVLLWKTLGQVFIFLFFWFIIGKIFNRMDYVQWITCMNQWLRILNWVAWQFLCPFLSVYQMIFGNFEKSNCFKTFWNAVITIRDLMDMDMRSRKREILTYLKIHQKGNPNTVLSIWKESRCT